MSLPPMSFSCIAKLYMRIWFAVPKSLSGLCVALASNTWTRIFAHAWKRSITIGLTQIRLSSSTEISPLLYIKFGHIQSFRKLRTTSIHSRWIVHLGTLLGILAALRHLVDCVNVQLPQRCSANWWTRFLTDHDRRATTAWETFVCIGRTSGGLGNGAIFTSGVLKF